MTGSLTRLKRLALRRLWSESPENRARRRCRALITTPFAALGGLTWGVFAAPVIGVGSQLLWGALGAFAFPFFMYVEQKAVPGLARLAHRLGLGEGNVAASTLEAGVVGGLIYFLTSVLGAPTVPAVGTALGIGAFYAFAMEYVLCGSAASDALTLIRGTGMGAAARPDQLSRAETLLRRGEHDAAIELYREALERTPRDAATWLRLARAHLAKGDGADALTSLRTGIERAKLGGSQDAYLVRQLHEMCVRRLADARAALPDLRAFLARHPEGDHAEWARREIADIEDGLYDDV